MFQISEGTQVKNPATSMTRQIIGKFIMIWREQWTRWNSMLSPCLWNLSRTLFAVIRTMLSCVQVRYFSSLLDSCYVVYQTQETVFHRDIQTPRRELKIWHAAEYFRWNLSVWIANAVLSISFEVDVPTGKVGGLWGHVPQKILKFRCLEMLFSTFSRQYIGLKNNQNLD